MYRGVGPPTRLSSCGQCLAVVMVLPPRACLGHFQKIGQIVHSRLVYRGVGPPTLLGLWSMFGGTSGSASDSRPRSLRRMSQIAG